MKDYIQDINMALDDEETKMFYMHLFGFTSTEISLQFKMSRSGYTKKFDAIKNKLKRKVLKIV